MARVPDATPDPTAAPATPEPFDPLSVNQAIDFQTPAEGAPAHTPDNEATLREAAASLGLDFDNVTPDDLAFLGAFADGALDGIAPDADPENPLIPGEGPTTTVPLESVATPDAAAPTTAEDAPPPPAGADESGRAGTTTPDSGGDANDGVPAAASPATPVAVTPPPGTPAFEIPSTLPFQAAPDPTPAPAPQEQLVQLADGSLVTLSTYQALIAQQQQPAPQPGQMPQMQASPAQPNPGFVPNAWSPTPGEYVDERAAFEINAMQQQQQQMAQQFAQMQQQNEYAVEMQRQNRLQSLAQAAEETKTGYGAHRGLTPVQADALMDNALELGMVGLYTQMYPEDPRRAVAAALENVYWQTPEFRDAEVARRVEETRIANQDAERKRALAAQTVSTPGSVPRTSGPARTSGERDAGMVAMIEADPTFVARQNGAR